VRAKSSLPNVLLTVLVVADAAAAFMASTPWLRAYQVARAPLLFAVAAALPALISALAWRALRFGAIVSYAASATGLLALLAVTSSFNLNHIWSGLVHVPAQLLSETLPLSGQSSTLGAPVVLTWLCAAVSAELLVRPARPASAAPAVPVAYFVLAFAATTSAPAGPTVAEAAGLVGTLVLVALARQGLIDAQVAQAQARAGGASHTATGSTSAAVVGQQPHRHAPLRRALLGGALAAAVAAGAAVAVSGIPAFASKPATISRPTQLLSGIVVDPLDALASLRDSRPAARPIVMFAVQVRQAWSGYMSVATLDTYDGDSWTFSATFRPTGGRVPGPATAGPQPGSALVVQRYFLRRSIGLPFLPAVDRPVHIDGLAVDTDANTGMLAAETLLPASYSVTSLAVPRTGATLPTGSVLAFGPSVPGGQDASYTALPSGSVNDVAAAVRFAVNLTGQPASPSFGFVQGLAQSLRVQERRVTPGTSAGAPKSTPAALAGTSLAQVINAVTVDHAATPEQFATFVAVVARYLGVPIRVVTGFRVTSAATARGPLPPGRYELTDRDAWTWDEIPVLGYGWVVLDPTPVATTANATAPPQEVKPSRLVKPRQATALPGKGAAHAIAAPVGVNLSQPLQVDWALLAGAGLPSLIIITLLSGGLLLPALRRRLRRVARHHAEGPALVAIGAWLELLDGLFRLGLEVPASATSTDVALQVAGTFGDDFAPATRTVGSLADQALYSARWPVDEAQAQLAWDSQDRLRRSLWRRAGWRARAKALLRVGNAPGRPVSARTGARRRSIAQAAGRGAR